MEASAAVSVSRHTESGKFFSDGNGIPRAGYLLMQTTAADHLTSECMLYASMPGSRRSRYMLQCRNSCWNKPYTGM